MKRIYSLLPRNVAQRIRNVLEFDGGVTDTHVLRAGADADTWCGTDFVYRPPPGSFPQASIPQGPPERAFDIKYYSRDVRRSALPGDSLIDASFGSTAGALARPGLIAAPKTGSPGSKNPAVERYDPSGLRTAMTTTSAAVARELRQHRPNHLVTPSWATSKERLSTAAWLAQQGAAGAPVDAIAGRPAAKRLQPWQYTQVNEW